MCVCNDSIASFIKQTKQKQPKIVELHDLFSFIRLRIEATQARLWANAHTHTERTLRLSLCPYRAAACGCTSGRSRAHTHRPSTDTFQQLHECVYERCTCMLMVTVLTFSAHRQTSKSACYRFAFLFRFGPLVPCVCVLFCAVFICRRCRLVIVRIMSIICECSMHVLWVCVLLLH